MTTASTVKFAGHTGLIEPLGVGCWAWGDASVWGMGGYDTSVSEATITEAYEASLEAGVTLFDTAEVYGDGESERIIGRMLAANPGWRDRSFIATKFVPLPQKIDVVGSARRALEASLERLGIDSVDLYQLHGPVSLRSASARAEALAALVHTGHARAVGVSNYSIREMRAIHGELAKRGVPLASNQIECSLLRNRPIVSGLIAACNELKVTPLAYSPIGQGRLTGKYSASNPPPGKRTFSAHPMAAVDPIVARLRAIGETHPGPDGPRTPSQVALRWLIQHGLVPIPGAKNAGQAQQNAGALGWELTDADMATLDALALIGKEGFFSGTFWQHG